MELSRTDRSTPVAGLRIADRVFRLAGVTALVLLAATIGLGLMGVAAWRPVFTAAHLAALVALAPLAAVMLRYAFSQARSAGPPGFRGVVRRYPATVAMLAVIAVAVVLSLANFEDGNRTLRRLANYTTVLLVLVLVIRYLRWSGPQAR